MGISSDEVRQQLGDLPGFLIRTRDAFYDHGSQPNAWIGEPGSQCRIDASSDVTGPDGPWGDKPFRWVAETCGMYLAATVEHLRCLGLMLENGGFLMSPEVIVRATYETSMRVAWILDTGSSPRQRAARVYLESFHGLRKALDGYSRLWPDVAKGLKSTRQKIFDQDVPALFWPDEIQLSDNIPIKDWSLAGESYPGPENIVSLLAADHILQQAVDVFIDELAIQSRGVWQRTGDKLGVGWPTARSRVYLAAERGLVQLYGTRTDMTAILADGTRVVAQTRSRRCTAPCSASSNSTAPRPSGGPSCSRV
jgi:hypothetical protein